MEWPTIFVNRNLWSIIKRKWKQYSSKDIWEVIKTASIAKAKIGEKLAKSMFERLKVTECQVAHINM